MKKVRLFLIVAIFMVLVGCAKQVQPSDPDLIESDIKVIYFSCTHTTEKVAIQIADALNCEIEEIIPAVAYRSEDLDYHNDSSRANREQNDETARPEIKNTFDLTGIDTIFLGYPIWWGKLPKIIVTFLDTYDLEEVLVVPFCTSGSSGISTSVAEIKKLEPTAQVLDGKRFSSQTSDAEVQSFLDSLNL